MPIISLYFNVLPKAATGGVLYKNLFLSISQYSQSCMPVKKRLQHRCFPVNIAKILRTPVWRRPSNDCFCFVLFCHYFATTNYLTSFPSNAPFLIPFKISEKQRFSSVLRGRGKIGGECLYAECYGYLLKI